MGRFQARRRASTGTYVLQFTTRSRDIALENNNPFKPLQSPAPVKNIRRRTRTKKRAKEAAEAEEQNGATLDTQTVNNGRIRATGPRQAKLGAKKQEDTVQIKFRAFKHAVQCQFNVWSQKSVVARLALRKSLAKCSSALVERMKDRALKIAEFVYRPNPSKELQDEIVSLRSRLASLEALVQESANQRSDNLTQASHPLAPAPAKAFKTPEPVSMSKPAAKASAKNPAYAKYHRMLSFGVPRSAVEQAMMKDGVDTRGLDDPNFQNDSSSANSGAPGPIPAPRPSISASALQQVRLRGANKTPQRKEKPKPVNNKSRSAVITLEALREVKLRATPQKQPKTSRARGNTPGAILSLEQLQQVKLRPCTPLVADKENCKDANNKHVSFHLRKTMGDRSPGGTPARMRSTRFADLTPLQERSPSRARSDGEFLELALRRKFASLYNSQPSPTQWSPGTNTSLFV